MPRQPKTTSMNQARPSNRRAVIHQEPAATRENTRGLSTTLDQTSQSKLTSTGSRAAARASSATPSEEQTRDQLYFRAAELGINGRSRMTKAALVDAIRSHTGAGGSAPRSAKRV
jgi:hypothetical protein